MALGWAGTKVGGSAVSDVFMSYKSEDRELVQTLAQALEAAGISVWWDKKISAGGSWRETIAGALNSAKVVIVAWSKRTEDSSGAAWVFNEVDEAQRMRLPIIPVQLEPCIIPLGYRHVQAANLAGWKGDQSNPEWQEVLDAVRAAIAGKPIGAAVRRAPAAPAAAGKLEKSGGGAGMMIALAGVIVLAGGGFFVWKSGMIGGHAATAVVAPASITIAAEPTAPAPAPALTETQIREQVAKEYAAQQAQTQTDIAAREQAAREQGAQAVRDEAAKEQALKDAAAKEVAARQAASAASAPLQIIYFSGPGAAGSYRREGGYWNEYRASGEVAFTFRQRTETQTRLELYDQSRDMTIVIDLNAKSVSWRQANGPMNFLYPVTTWKR
jgi:TIR domain